LSAANATFDAPKSDKIFLVFNEGSPTMTQPEILNAIPHRPPMLLVDEIVESSEKTIVCKKHFKETEYFTQGHFPNYPLVPGVILCECCLQAGAILLSQFTPRDGSVPVATRLDGVKFKKMVRPGDTVQMDVTLNEVVGTAYFLTGKVTVDGKLAARLDFACTVAAPQ
jgi:3-hydroxyacyl-[acyl-carrier-protein] dehydratase